MLGSMQQTKVLAAILAIAIAQVSSGQNKSSAPVSPKPRLWAVIGMTRPLYEQSEADRIQVSFAVVNDGQTTVDPGADAAHLYINGVEPNDWYLTAHNGPRTLEFNALPPGKALEFGYLLGRRYVPKPGIYHLRWEGTNFKAPEIIFRVMP
jgi:hypothetical protein